MPLKSEKNLRLSFLESPLRLGDCGSDREKNRSDQFPIHEILFQGRDKWIHFTFWNSLRYIGRFAEPAFQAVEF